MKIYIQVVIYNKEMVNSLTLTSLCSQNNKSSYGQSIILNIHDNSKLSCFDSSVIDKLQEKYKVNYEHTPDNRTLRDIYNNCIDNLNVDDILLLLDDDSWLPENFIDTMYSDIKKYDSVNLFAPRVIVNDKLYSPYKTHSFISRPLFDLQHGIIPCSNHAFINSGLAIRGRFFIETGFRYPPSVEFYGTDTVFSHIYRQRQSVYLLMDLVIKHNVNNHPENCDTKCYAGALSKVMQFWYANLHGLSKIAYFVYMLIYVIKLTLKSRSSIFFKMFMGLKYND
ncbi:glycosyltransferase [Escherichia albertii]|uniref:glycosyltransferase n=1 Tax=Escherichia albertii TaxID=208962 RepID=UPI00211A4232|nr:glycosyltransferase [Escherichia albertii]MCQ8931893.1 glycosyltransferase [Escherichia albertii]MCQ8967191.1 glycosyltransferase [Escherichia albertii]UUK97466.1 glycosyltransferase [Escherichia albertii]WCC57299.1 putative glycosyl transferase family 2 [Escherichia albertii]